MKYLPLITLSLVVAVTAASPASAQRGAGDRFAEADANGDGTVTRAEFQAERLERFARMDRNKDGAISRDDFGRLLRARPQAGQRLDELLAEADANRDGRVTHAELERAPMPLFDRADTSGDGRIDAAERRAASERMADLRANRR